MTATTSTSDAASLAAPTRGRAPVDIMIPTFNERVNLPHALDTVKDWAANVFVLDSGSTDGTQEIARQAGATVVEHPWEGYARQKNWGLDNLPFSSPWVFILDADEGITPQLRDEIIALTSRPPDDVRETGFLVNRYLMFMGKRIRHCGYFPSWNLRLFKRGKAHYEDRAVHEHMIVEGPEGHLRGLMSHEDRRGLEHYIAKHNRYSTLEAELFYHGTRSDRPELQPALLGNPVQRKRFFRNTIYPKLPAKWFLRFIYMYVLKLGILDGLTGLRFCLLISTHELFTSLKLSELHRQARLERLSRTAVPDTTTAQLMRVDDGPKTTPATPPAEAQAPRIAEPASPVHQGNGHAPTAQPPAAVQRITQGTDTQDKLDDVMAKRVRSPWTFREKVGRVLWMIAQATLFRWSFHNWYGFRRTLLRLFGAKLAAGVRVRPTTHIEIPWNLTCGRDAAIGDDAIIYSLGTITLGERVVVSQYAHLCAGTHDYTSRLFPLLRPPIVIEDDAWIAADAFVGPNVRIGARSVVGARATVLKDVPPDQVVGGNPAKFIKPRVLRD